MSNQPPIDTIRDGSVKASIWRNEGQNGPFYSVTYGRTYTGENDKPKDAHDFSGGDILKQQRLAGKAYDRIQELREADRAQSESRAA